jgi:ribosome biogenesis GTPase
MTVIAGRSNCEAIICINKCDLDPAKELYDIYKLSGFVTIRTSAVTGQGIAELVKAISKSACAFTGNSGVGKSSILNAIDSNFAISVGDISKKLGRGRHTTRHVELYKLSCGALVADTPGFSAFDMDYIAPKEDLQYLFNDFAPYRDECRFIDCAHIKEPECMVLKALEDGRIQKSRHDSYVRLYEQASKFKHWQVSSG